MPSPHGTTHETRSPARAAVLRATELLVFAAIPLAVGALAIAAFAQDDRLALDFHHELYRQAEAVVDGGTVIDPPDANLADRANAVWPPAAVLPLVPVTAIPPGVADWLATAFVIACLVAALWLLGVTDWRVYGVIALWPATIEGIQTANASIPLTLLVALMWRYRDRAGIAGLALGYAVAVKLFLWPVVAWLALGGRRRAAAIAAGVVAASLLLLLPFTTITDYVRLLRSLAETFEHEAYTPFALLTDVGLPDTAARVATTIAGLAVLALAARRRSLGLALAAALVLSPIVWRHFFVLLAVPIALARPRLDVLWFVPLVLWVGDGTFNGAPWQTAVCLAAVAATFVLCERGPTTRLTVPARAPEEA